MTDTLKTLGQSNPALLTLTTLYTVPVATSATVSSFLVCNQSLTAATFRISIAVAGAADDPKQYLYYDQSIAPKDTFAGTLGLTLATTDVVRVYSSSSTLSFNIFGVEIT